MEKRRILGTALRHWEGPVLALALAFAGQKLFEAGRQGGIALPFLGNVPLSLPTALTAGAGLFLVAIWLWARIFQGTSGWEAPEEPLGAAPRPGLWALAPWRKALLLSGMGSALAAAWLYAARGESGMVRLLWLAGILLPLAGIFPSGRRGAGSDTRGAASPPFRWQHVLVLGAVTGVGLWLRLYRLEGIPYDLHGDMASYGLAARDILAGLQRDLFASGWASLPDMAFLPAAAGMKLFGDNLFGLRMSAVVGGVLCLPALYLLAWRLFDSHRLAALAAAVLAVNIPHIHFSRIPAYMDPWPWSLFGAFLLVDGLRGRKPFSLALSGLLVGLGLQMYYSGRVVPVVLLLFLIYLLVFHRSWMRGNREGLVLAGFTGLAALGPALIYYGLHPAVFASRTREVWLFAPDILKHLANKYNVGSTLEIVGEQTWRSLLTFNFTPDSSTQFGYPRGMFPALLAPFVPLGLGRLVTAWRRPGAFFMAAWVILILLMGSLLTVDAPFWPRLVGILPAAALAAAAAMEDLIVRAEASEQPRFAHLITAGLGVIIATAGVFSWQQYSISASRFAHQEALIGRFLSSLPSEVSACTFGQEPNLEVRETAFLAGSRRRISLPVEDTPALLGACPPPSAWIFTSQTLARLPEVEARYPGGWREDHVAENGDYVFTSYVTGGVGSTSGSAGDSPDRPSGDPANKALPVTLVLAGLVSATVYGVQKKRPLLYLHTPWTQVIAAHLSSWKPGRVDTAALPEAVRRIFLPATGLALVYLAQAVYDIPQARFFQQPWLLALPTGQRLTIAFAVSTLGAALWAWAVRPKLAQAHWSGAPNPEDSSSVHAGASVEAQSPVQYVSPPEVRTSVPAGKIPLAAGGVSLACVLAAVILFALRGESTLVRGLWLAGIVLVLVSAWKAGPQGMAARGEFSPRFRVVHYVLLAALLGLALALRVYRLGSIPLEISTDMASYGLAAREYVLGQTSLIFGTGWFYIPRMEFQLAALSMRLLGSSLTGLYAATVLLGMMNLLGVYLLTWRLFDSHLLAALTLAVLAANPAHIEYSRISAFITPWAAGYAGLYFLVDGLRGRKTLSLAAAGVLTGFSLQVYPAGRVLPLLLAALLLYAWLIHREWLRENLSGLVWMAVGLLAALGPNLVEFGRNWEVYTARAREVSLFAPEIQAHLRYTYQTISPWMVLWEQVRRSFLTFQYYPDVSAHFAYPHAMFPPVLSPLLAAGVGYALFRLRKPGAFFTVSAFLIILVTGGVLTVNAPTWSRLVGLIPLAAILIALPLGKILSTGGRARPLLLLAAAGLMVYAGVTQWREYLQAVSDYARPVVDASRYLAQLPEEATACGVTSGWGLSWSEAQFMGWPRRLVELDANNPDLAAEECQGSQTAWIFTPDQQAALAQVRARQPGGLLENHESTAGTVNFISYWLP